MSEEMIVKKCIMCGCDNDHLWGKALDNYKVHTTSTEYQLVQCGNCELIYLSPRPTPEHILRHYPEWYPAYKRADESPSNDRLRKLRDTVERIHYNGAKCFTLLDIGCGDGSFLNCMALIKGWDVTGIEIDSKAASFARDAFGLNVHCGFVEDIAIDHKFDVVTMWDVLEHLSDPKSVLVKIGKWMEFQDSCLIIGLPNIESLESKLFGSSWFGLEVPRHFYHFSPKTITKLLNETGFDVVELNFPLITYLGKSLLIRLGRSPYESRMGKTSKNTIRGNPVIKIIKDFASWLLAVVSKYFRRGSYMVVVAQPVIK